MLNDVSQVAAERLCCEIVSESMFRTGIAAMQRKDVSSNSAPSHRRRSACVAPFRISSLGGRACPWRSRTH